MNGSFLALALVGCGGFGLDSHLDAQAVPAPYADPADTGASPAGNDGAEPTAVDLAGRLYAISAEDMHVAEPPGLDALWGKVLTRPLLLYVSAETDRKLKLNASLGAADGTQDPCEKVRAFPDADWTANPLFSAGPGEMETSFAGSPATFRDLVLTGSIDEYGFGWHGGTLSAELDTREIQPALGGMSDVCGMVETLGGVCHACADGEVACFDLQIDQVEAEYVDAPFDLNPTCEGV